MFEAVAFLGVQEKRQRLIWNDTPCAWLQEVVETEQYG